MTISGKAAVIAALLLTIFVVRMQKRFSAMAQRLFQEFLIQANNVRITVALTDRAFGINLVD